MSTSNLDIISFVDNIVLVHTLERETWQKCCCCYQTGPWGHCSLIFESVYWIHLVGNV